LALNGTHVYALYDDWLWVIDVSNPSSPQTVFIQEQYSSYYDVLIKDGYLLASGDSPGLSVFDISNPAHPFVAVAAEALVGWLASAGDYVYIAGGSAGLGIVQVASPETGLHEVGQLEIDATCEDVVVQGTLAYSADGMPGLDVIDIADPANPVLLGRCGTSGYAQRVALYDHYACVADRDSGLWIVDVADSRNPREVGYIIPQAPVTDVAVFGHYALAATSGAGLRVVDLSDPANPQEVGHCLEGGHVLCVDSGFGYAFLTTDDDTTLYSVDLAVPANPSIVGWDTTDRKSVV
jgi:hypothetical protein